MNPAPVILLVDDVAANLETLRELLEPEAYRLIEAADGRAALALAAAEPPDLVLLDVMMPGMDGYDVCRRLRADARLAEVPVIMITALDDQPSRLLGLEAGADDFITKPFNRAELRARARTITRLNRSRRLAETQSELRESVRRFSELAENIQEVFWVADAKTSRKLYISPAYEQIWGRTCKSVYASPHSWTDAIHPDDRQRVSRAAEARQAPGAYDEEFRIIRPDGTERWVSDRAFPVRDGEGAIQRWVGLARDITERKAAELAMRESDQWLRAIFEQAALGVVQTDVATGAFIRVNQRFCDLVGYSPEEIMRLSFAEITYRPDLEANLENVVRLRAGLIREFTQEKRYVRKDGSIVWTNIAVSAIGPLGRTPASFIAFVHDITERKQLDEHFLQAQKMEALGQFSGGVAHDFNNILAAVGGYTELARLQLEGNPAVQELLESVMQASRRAADLVRQILTFSRQEPQARQLIRLQPLVLEALKLMRATIPATIEFDTSIEADAPTVLANGSQILQILMNLGINAWHAMKNRTGRLQVKLERCMVTADYAATKPGLRPGDYVRIAVSDTGVGMDPATLRRIFEPFFTTKAPGEGTGLGLSVVHGIMENHDGAVTVHSHVGEGTVFRLYFPVLAGETAAPSSCDGQTPRGHGERILVVDDEELLVNLMRRVLNNLGYEVESTNRPAEALGLVEADPLRFALVITDQTMPGMTGLALAGELRRVRAELPVILMSGYSLSLTALRVEEAGIRQLLVKPSSLHALGVAVHHALTPLPPP